MKENNYSEDSFVDYLKSKFIPKSKSIGIGDDCSVTEYSNKVYQIASSDMLVEGVHFLRNNISAEQLGKKSMAVNISDIAAMGGCPEAIFVSLAVPKNIDKNFKTNFYQGISFYCNKYDIDLLGGDLSSSADKIFINIHIQGRVDKSKIKLRSGAKEGDLVCVSGEIGDSGLGLEFLKNSQANINQDFIASDVKEYCIDKHLNPEPRLEFGSFLSQQESVTSMMDLSDGIASDIKKICKSSDCGVEINLDQMPHSRQSRLILKNLTDLELSTKLINFGEDYELLFSVSPSQIDKLKNDFVINFKSPIFVIGKINSKNCIQYFLNKKPVQINENYFSHF